MSHDLDPLKPELHNPHSEGATDPATPGFERELKHAFGRVDAPETLAKFLAAAAEAEAAREASGRKLLWFRPNSGARVLVLPRAQAWMGGAIAAALLLGVLGAGEGLHLRQKHREAEATRQFATAERITDQALERAREQMERAGVGFEQ